MDLIFELKTNFPFTNKDVGVLFFAFLAMIILGLDTKGLNELSSDIINVSTALLALLVTIYFTTNGLTKLTANVKKIEKRKWYQVKKKIEQNSKKLSKQTPENVEAITEILEEMQAKLDDTSALLREIKVWNAFGAGIFGSVLSLVFFLYDKAAPLTYDIGGVTRHYSAAVFVFFIFTIYSILKLVWIYAYSQRELHTTNPAS